MFLEISPLYLGICLILNIFLSFRIVRLRKKLKIGIGDGGNPELHQAIRVHSNFVEQVPLTIIGIMVLEIQSLHYIFVHLLGIILIAGRLLHFQGLSSNPGYSKGRFLGTLMTFGLQALVAIAVVLNFAHIVVKEGL